MGVVERERDWFVVPLIYAFIGSLVDACMCPDWDQTHNLGVLG